ncbi:IS phage Tn transposon-like protein [Nitrosococcus watsonii]|uniref:IS phage Tn transposon-related protein n=1 Tax=Nitrosococcus watsoni (strain C-113) TaxID=105559 RepID=D8K9D3_NITWC|nr:IS phage Tn transposon-related protein [Nitrosococcus watsonii C-113]
MLPLPAGRETSAGVGAARYRRLRPKQTLLYQIVEDYYPAFVSHMAARGMALPGYFQREFEDHLTCDGLEHGFLRVRCDTCHAEHQRRGFCASHGARRTADCELPVNLWRSGERAFIFSIRRSDNTIKHTIRKACLVVLGSA